MHCANGHLFTYTGVVDMRGDRVFLRRNFSPAASAASGRAGGTDLDGRLFWSGAWRELPREVASPVDSFFRSGLCAQIQIVTLT